MSGKIIQLQEYVCFRGLTEDRLSTVSQLANVVSYPPGQVLFQEGKSGDSVYFITKGKVDIFYSIGEEGPAKVDQVFAEELIGCSALIPPFTYIATTKSQTDIEVLKIDANALRSLMKENCPLGFTIQQNIMQMLMNRITNFRLGLWTTYS